MDIIIDKNFVFNSAYSDIYFSNFEPLGEKAHVFCDSIDLDRLANDKIVVGESGFGTGINFLILAKKIANTDKKLHYVSIEKNPIPKDILKQIYTNLSLEKFFFDFLEIYPNEFINGIYRINVNKNIILDIYCGDIRSIFRELNFLADFWFLDGFSPAKNPEMWDLETLENITKLLKPNATVATYTASSNVRKILSSLGFEVKILKGFGKKRHMLRAFRVSENKEEEKNQKRLKISIIGAGISGIVTAFKLQQEGFDVSIFEKNHQVAQNGSSNVLGALLPLITQKNVLLGDMHYFAFKMAVEFYKTYIKDNKLIDFSGASIIAFDEKLKKRYSNSYDFFNLDSDGTIFIKEAARLNPNQICQFLSKELEIFYNFEFCGLKIINGKNIIMFKNKKEIDCDIVIFAMGSHSEELFGKGLNPIENFDKNLNISSVRGQISLIDGEILDKINSKIISAKGYYCSRLDKFSVIGATFDRLRYYDDIDELDNLKNLSDTKPFFKNIPTILGANVGYRSYSGDRFPIIGKMHDINFYYGTNSNRFLDGVFINCAHGARGLSTSILGSEIILDFILNRPFCVTNSILAAVNPARFTLRKLKKEGQI